MGRYIALRLQRGTVYGSNVRTRILITRVFVRSVARAGRGAFFEGAREASGWKKKKREEGEVRKKWSLIFLSVGCACVCVLLGCGDNCSVMLSVYML